MKADLRSVTLETRFHVTRIWEESNILWWILRKLGDFWMEIGRAHCHEPPGSLTARNYLTSETIVAFLFGQYVGLCWGNRMHLLSAVECRIPTVWFINPYSLVFPLGINYDNRFASATSKYHGELWKQCGKTSLQIAGNHCILLCLVQHVVTLQPEEETVISIQYMQGLLSVFCKITITKHFCSWKRHHVAGRGLWFKRCYYLSVSFVV
jgi:hypothetical protein